MESSGWGGNEKTNEVVLFYGSRTSSDILGRDLIDSWARAHPKQLKVVHILSDEPAGAADSEACWSGRTGYINKAAIEEEAPNHGPDMEDDVIVFVCGPPAMYTALCGPREEADVNGLLGEMGYSKDQVYKF